MTFGGRLIFCRYIIILLASLFVTTFGGGAGLLYAQRNAIYVDNIATLQVVAGVRWQDMPIIKLGGSERINISFDELSHSYHRFSYTITHLDADFTPSENLFSSDYIEGFDSSLTIDDYHQSINTLQNYTHYCLQIPNEQCKLTMSGNYRLDIKDEDEDIVVASAYFMVSESIANVSLLMTANTDKDIRGRHQQIELSVDYSNLRTANPRGQIKGYVLQNGRWDNARMLPMASRITPRTLEWTHCHDLIFEGGNEYHKFEILDIHRNSMNVESNTWDGERWHTLLWTDTERPSYVYDETARGSYYIRNSDNYQNDITSEYVDVHFTLKTEPLPYRIYVNGIWTNHRFLPQYEMCYDDERGLYEAVVPLKYGYYTYQYLMLGNDDVIESDDISDVTKGYNKVEPMIPPSEGSFFETRNKYNALIYYRANSDRADRLVGVY